MRGEMRDACFNFLVRVVTFYNDQPFAPRRLASGKWDVSKSGPGWQPILRNLVGYLPLTFAYGDHEHQDFVIKYLIDQAITGAFQFHFIAVW